MEILCPWEGATYFWMYSSNIPSLLYYSHIPALLIVLFWGVFVFLNAQRDIRTYSLVAIFGFFALWNIFDLILWATNRPDITIFFWSLQILLEILVFLFSFYLIYSYQRGKVPSFWINILILIGVLPFIILIPTNYNLIGVYLYDCTAIENGVAKYYSYILEALFLLVISVVSMETYRKSNDTVKRKETIMMGLGISLFLLFFIYGNLIGSYYDNWVVAQFGLFGMPIFVTFLVYATVKFKAFNIKLIGTQALVGALLILVVSILAVRSIENVRIIVSLTSIIILVLGIQLVRSVKREIEAKEKIEKLAGELQVANEGQANLIHIINHQIKGYLAKARNVFSELLTEPEYGPISEPAKPMINEGFKSLTEGVDFVTDFLNASNIEKGTYKYEMQSFDMSMLVQNVVEKQKGVAEEKGLSFKFNVDEGDYNMHGDKAQLEQAVRNLIDNSIRYTPKGEVKIQISKVKDKVLLKIMDTGVGISDELKPKLFTKGGRDNNSLKVNINSTGFGLSFVKDVVEAHHGRVWAESAGINKGSTFFMELPVNS